MYEDLQRGFLSEDCNLKNVPIDTPETHVDVLQREEQSKPSYQLRGFKVNVMFEKRAMGVENTLGIYGK